MCSEIKVDDSIVFTDVVAKLNQLRQLKDVNSNGPQEQKKWADQLTQLALIYGEVSSFAHEFDYSPSLRYNGVRTFMKMVTAYFVRLSKTIQVLKKNATDKKHVEELTVLQGQCQVFLTMGNSIKRIHQNWAKRGSPAANSEEFYADAVESKIQATDELSHEVLFNFYHLKFIAPWFPDWVRSFVRIYIKLNYWVLNPISRSLFGIFSSSATSKFFADFALKYRVKSLQKINKKTEGWMFDTCIWAHNLMSRDVQVSYLTLGHRQRDWVINESSASIEKFNNNNPHTGKTIKCVLMKPRDFTSGNLIVHIHGGGFILLSAKSQIPLLTETVRETKSALLSIDYSLSPQAKYPVALQECLDVYLNVVSSNPITGFKAEKIIFMGESAGGYFTIALAIAVAELRALQTSLNEQLTPLPHAIVPIFPVVSGCVGHAFPSRALVDTILAPSCPFAMLNAYSGPMDDEQYMKEHKGFMWHQENNVIRQVTAKINSRVHDPFLHLIGYKHLDRLKSVPMYIQVGEFDPVLDDSIQMAKLWQGKVVFDVIPEVPHGWFLFENVGYKFFTGCALLRQRVKEALNGEWSQVDEK